MQLQAAVVLEARSLETLNRLREAIVGKDDFVAQTTFRDSFELCSQAVLLRSAAWVPCLCRTSELTFTAASGS